MEGLARTKQRRGTCAQAGTRKQKIQAGIRTRRPKKIFLRADYSGKRIVTDRNDPKGPNRVDKDRNWNQMLQLGTRFDFNRPRANTFYRNIRFANRTWGEVPINCWKTMGIVGTEGKKRVERKGKEQRKLRGPPTSSCSFQFFSRLKLNVAFHKFPIYYYKMRSCSISL